MKKAPMAPFLSPNHSRSDRERGAAAARRGGIGIADHELRAFQAFAVVDLGARQVLEAHGVHQQGDALVLHTGVAFFALLVEGEAVLEAGAAAAGDEHAQLEGDVALLLDQLFHLARCGVGEDERFYLCVHVLIIAQPRLPASGAASAAALPPFWWLRASTGPAGLCTSLPL